MRIERPRYLNKLIDLKDNRRVKIITGLRRSGKSYLLFNLYKDYLIKSGINSNQIIEINLESVQNLKLRNPLLLSKEINKTIYNDDYRYYVFIDEIQFVEEIDNPYLASSPNRITFVDVVLDLVRRSNVDLYITGSNSHMLSSDILTQFRDRGDEVRVYPLSFSEFRTTSDGYLQDSFDRYCLYGGMPYVCLLDTHQKKSEYLMNLFLNTYIRDVVERNDVRNDSPILKNLLSIVASSVGSLTNPHKISNTYKSARNESVSSATIERYIEYFEQAFLLEKALRYDVKGRKYISTPYKLFFCDSGLRNSLLNFRQNELNHVMENVIFNELRARGFNVDVGSVSSVEGTEDNNRIRKNYEVDFIVNYGSGRTYIQSAYNIDVADKLKQETASLSKIDDSFQKIVIVRNPIVPRYDDRGIFYVGVEDFLLNDEYLMSI